VNKGLLKKYVVYKLLSQKVTVWISEGKCLRVYDWIIILLINVSIMCYMFGNSSSNPNWVCCFSFLKQPCLRHIMAIFQDDNVKIHEALIVKEWLWGSWRIIFTRDSLRDFGMCWRRLYRVLDSCIDMYAPFLLDQTSISDIFTQNWPLKSTRIVLKMYHCNVICKAAA